MFPEARRRFALACFLGGFAGAALAGSTAQPALIIDADHSTATNAPGSPHGKAVYEGHVTLIRGAALMHGMKAVVYTLDGKLDRAVVSGDPASFSWQPQTGRRIDGHAMTVTYIAGSDSVVLTGNVVLTRGAETFSAAEIHYALTSGTLTATSGHEDHGSRVHVVMPPPGSTGNHRP